MKRQEYVKQNSGMGTRQNLMEKNPAFKLIRLLGDCSNISLCARTKIYLQKKEEKRSSIEDKI